MNPSADVAAGARRLAVELGSAGRALRRRLAGRGERRRAAVAEHWGRVVAEEDRGPGELQVERDAAAHPPATGGNDVRTA